MFVKFISSDMSDTEHKIDAGSAIALLNQIRGWEDGSGKITLDDEAVLVKEARLKFFTQGPDMGALLTLTLEDPEKAI